jgi:hypothetical protein
MNATAVCVTTLMFSFQVILLSSMIQSMTDRQTGRQIGETRRIIDMNYFIDKDRKQPYP